MTHHRPRRRAHTTWLEIPSDHPPRRRHGAKTLVECPAVAPTVERRSTPRPQAGPWGGAPFITPSGRVFFPPGTLEALSDTCTSPVVVGPLCSVKPSLRR
ncbi:MAG: hypothetical protein AAGF11_13245 [Myxococcota bacterium]